VSGREKYGGENLGRDPAAKERQGAKGKNQKDEKDRTDEEGNVVLGCGLGGLDIS
jgi:hypothetical protein